MRHWLALLVVSLAMVPALWIGGSAANIPSLVAPAAAAGVPNCVIHASMWRYGSGVESVGALSCDGSASTSGISLQLQYCSGWTGGTSCVSNTWVAYGSVGHCSGASHLGAFVETCAYLQVPQPLKLYRTKTWEWVTSVGSRLYTAYSGTLLF